MAQLEYSLEALNVLRKFYRAQALVYVEGDDDVPFWTSVFATQGDMNVVVEPAGGVEELDKFVRRIEEEDACLIVARDADYTQFQGTRSNSDRVLYSHGYSIENSLYTRKAIRAIAHIAHRKTAPEHDDVDAWLTSLASSLRPVVVNDLASTLDKLGVVALSNNCESFMVNANSPLTSKVRIAARLKTIEARIPKESRDKAEAILTANCEYCEDHLRGHVLASAVLRFVREHSGRSVSNETLYSSAITMFSNDVAADHIHTDHYIDAANRALSSLLKAA
jgi:hypothetical protein